MKAARFDSSEGNVFKYVFTDDSTVLEAVLYRYENFYERTVICCSTMSGCPVGCTFCGTGKKFIRNIKSEEIINQILYILKDMDIEDIDSNGKRFQIMFMSMGEPFLNYEEVKNAIIELHKRFPNAELLVSTIAPNKDEEFADFIKLSKQISKIGLQFSIHKAFDVERDDLIPYKNKYNLSQIRDYGILWWKETGRHPYLNYCIDGTNNGHYSANELWVTNKVQMNNQDRSVRILYKNEWLPISKVAELEKKPYMTIYSRTRRGKYPKRRLYETENENRIV